MTSSTLPHLTADDEPTARIAAVEMADTVRASRPSFVPYPAPLMPAIAAHVRRRPSFWQRLSRRVRVAVADFILGDIRWDEKRVLSAALAERERGIAWDRSDGFDPAPLRAWKDAQLEREHATYALVVAMGQVRVP